MINSLTRNDQPVETSPMETSSSTPPVAGPPGPSGATVRAACLTFDMDAEAAVLTGRTSRRSARMTPMSHQSYGPAGGSAPGSWLCWSGTAWRPHSSYTGYSAHRYPRVVRRHRRGRARDRPPHLLPREHHRHGREDSEAAMLDLGLKALNDVAVRAARPDTRAPMWRD